MADIQGIYEDVATLQEQVALLQTQMSNAESNILNIQTNIAPIILGEGADLHSLDIGRYIIPNSTVSGSLLNKPTNANTATGFIDVVAGGSAGQKMMYYYPCAKEGASYWQCSYYAESWGDWHEINVFDSGWIDLPLTGSVVAFNDEQKPRYRRIGKEVFLSGVVKNISAFNTVITTLPLNYRPSKKLIIAVPSTATKFSRISIQTNGVMTYEQSNDDIVGTTNWHSIACNFNVD